MKNQIVNSISMLGVILALGCTPKIRSFLVQPIQITGNSSLTAGSCLELKAKQATNSFPGEILLSATNGSTFSDPNCQISLTSFELSGANQEQTFYYFSQTSGTHEIEAYSAALNGSGLKQIKVNPDVLFSMDFEIPQTTAAAANFNMNVKLLDRFGNVTTASGGTILFERQEQGSPNGPYIAFEAKQIDPNQGNYVVPTSVNQAATFVYRMTYNSFVETDTIQVVPGLAATLELSNFGATPVTINTNRSLDVTVRDGGGNLTNADINLSTATPGASLPSTQSCPGTCTLNNIRFTQLANGVSLRASVSGNTSVYAELPLFNVENQNSIQLSSNSIILGQAVYVNALIDPEARNPNTQFQWDFGSQNALGQSTAEGVVQAFLYNTPSVGDYTIQLTVTTAGQAPRVYTMPVQVQPQSALQNQITYYVARTNDPTTPGNPARVLSSTEQSPTTLDAAIADIESRQAQAALTQAELNINLLLKRPDTNIFSDRFVIAGDRQTAHDLVYTAFKVNGKGRLTIKGYGSGAFKPTIVLSNQNTYSYLGADVSFIHGRQDGLVIEDVIFLGPLSYRNLNYVQSTHTSFIAVSGSDHTFHNVEFTYGNTAIRAAEEKDAFRSNYLGYERRGVFNCTFKDLTRNAIFDIGGKDLALKNNTFEYSRNHMTQFAESERVVISQNSFSFSEARGASGSNYMNLRKGAITFEPGDLQTGGAQPINDIQIIDNNFFANLKNIEITAVDGSQMEHLRISKNKFISDESVAGIYFRPMQQAIKSAQMNHLIVQNNFFSRPGTTLNFDLIFIEIGVENGPTVQNTTIRHNSFSSIGEQIVAILSHAEHQGLDLRYNIYSFDDLEATNQSGIPMRFRSFVPGSPNAPYYGLGVMDLRVVSQSELQSSGFIDGRSVIDVPTNPNFLAQYHLEGSSFNIGQWNALNQGQNDFYGDPLFIDPVSSNLRLQTTSPVKDLTQTQSVVSDVDSNQRDALNDPGAHEIVQ